MTAGDDRFNFARFLDAQAKDFARACDELGAGRKTTHWIWYVFPQLAALGRSPTAKFYGITSLEEVRAYVAHPVLGPRLGQAAMAALASGERDPHRLFGAPDDLKVRSSLTLFRVADPAAAPLAEALDTFYGGEPDPATLSLLGIDRVRFDCI